MLAVALALYGFRVMTSSTIIVTSVDEWTEAILVPGAMPGRGALDEQPTQSLRVTLTAAQGMQILSTQRTTAGRNERRDSHD